MDNMLPIEDAAEKAILGAILIDPECFYEVGARLTPSDFYSLFHHSVYEAIVRIASEQKPVDILSIEQHLKASGDKRLDFTNCLAELGELTQQTGTSKNILSYVEIVKKASIRRETISLAVGLQLDARKPDEDIVQTLDVVSGKLSVLLDDDADDDHASDASEGVSKAVDLLERYAKRAASGELVGVSTGIPELDLLTQGFNPSDLIILAARPSMGKTTLLQNCIEAAMLKSDDLNVVFSLEMPTDQIMLRMMCSIGSVDFQSARTGSLADADWARVNFAASEVIEASNLIIDDKSGVSPLYIRSKCRQLQRKYGKLNMIAIDYLQLMTWPKYAAGDSRTNEITHISKELKSIAKEFECPVVALSQLNRDLEKRPDKRPINADLRDSGAIEQDADLIMFIYRDEVYNENSQDAGIAEIIIGKQRNGPLGTVKVKSRLNMCRFEPI